MKEWKREATQKSTSKRVKFCRSFIKRREGKTNKSNIHELLQGLKEVIHDFYNTVLHSHITS